MKLYITLLLGLALAAPVKQSGVVRLPMKKQTKPASNETVHSFFAIGSDSLDNHISYYSIDLDIGSPAQTLPLQIDTGSSDMWVRGSGSQVSPSFNPGQSNTFHELSEAFSITYVGGAAAGDWVTDTVAIGSAVINNQQFAVVNNNQAGGGVLGVGLQGIESVNNKYPNVPLGLVNSGNIARNMYSLYLDDLEASSGFILFGGVQPNKWSGQLWTVPLTSQSTFTVQVGAMKAGSNSIPMTAFNALLDSGTSFTYLPDDIVSAIASQFGATYDSDHGAYYTSSYSDDWSLTYTFSGAEITVPASEVLISSSIYGGPANTHMLTVLPQSQTNGFTILGDTFLRGVYAIYDLDNLEVSLAQASFDSSDGPVYAITDTMPWAQRAPNA